MSKEEEWDICPENWEKNFKCMLNNRGRWRLEEGKVFGKWLFVMDKIGRLDCPTNADVRNILSGVLEAEKRNDIFRLNNKEVIDAIPQKREQLRKFRECLDEIEASWENENEEQKKI